MSRFVLLCVLACASALHVGVPARAPAAVSRAAVSMAGAAPAKPKTVTRQKTAGPKGGGGKGGGPALEIAKPKRKSQTEDVPMWKVLLLGDEDYECDPVCDVLRGVMPEINNEREAKALYDECMAGGKALLMVCPKEHAEGYVEQLARADPDMIVYSEIVEEKTGQE